MNKKWQILEADEEKIERISKKHRTEKNPKKPNIDLEPFEYIGFGCQQCQSVWA